MNSNQTGIQIDVHQAQADFAICRDVPYIGFVGGRGAGKSTACALRLYQWSMMEPGRYGMYAPTFPLLADTIQFVFLQIARPHIRSFNQSRNMIYMQSGSEIICRSLDDPEKARGPSLAGAVWDEASLCSESAFDILIACLRHEGKQGWLGAGFTPRGLRHWTAKIFNDVNRPDVKCFHSATMANPFNPPEFANTLRRQYTTGFAEQEIEGKFVSLEGNLMKRHWFKTVDAIPPLRGVCRYWDLASTPFTGENDPDWTAGAKVGLTTEGQWIILDMRHERLSPQATELLVQHTADLDTKKIRIVMEEEGGASGKALCDHYRRRVLPGFFYKSIRTTGDKVTRAMPLAAAAEAGNVMLLRREWNEAFLDEAADFGPDCAHDDQIDATSGAMDYLTTKRISPHVGVSDRPEERTFQTTTDHIEREYADLLATAKTPEERERIKQSIIEAINEHNRGNGKHQADRVEAAGAKAS